MKRIISVLILFAGITAFSQKIPTVMKTEFPEAALQDIVVTSEGDSVTIEKAFSNYKGQIVLLDLWATWCGDCIKNMPALKALHEKNPDVTFVYLSMDKTEEAWKKGIEKYQIEGQHFYMGNNWKGNFGTGIDLNWIPRYMVLDQNGKIADYYSVKADDPKVQETIDRLRNK
ncbi:TlpA family protein disulfide reductase [Empedobacter brevis]|uniref:TlpA family protein disulfide reductase n=1 Tax=Empedobacter brevis TaxID=247 RepID=A0AAJ1QFG0_9FLAO|nr:TlpA disulfide reductase family protein [Empedobacter brevis]MDM1072941.1 TlpA family protein disulfide reductase [Empedobacter brevis]QES91740.1 TlpA family protein disulfide reductase [Empedobacter brevis]